LGDATPPLAQLVDRQIRLSRPLRIVGSLAWQAGDLVGFGGLHVSRGAP